MTAPLRWWTPERMASRNRIDDVAWTPDGRLAWLRSPGDRSTVMVEKGEGAVELTPGRSVRAGVGYGGGDFCIGGRHIYFAERSGPLLRAPLAGGPAEPVLPRFGSVASPEVSPDGQHVLCVHSLDGTDVLALAGTRGDRWPVDLVRGADFYMQPTWHPSGTRIAWVEWDHPRMPWDGAVLMEAELDDSRHRVVRRSAVAGSSDRPVFQPCWSRDGRSLAWIESDGEEFLLRVRDEESGEVKSLLRSPGLLPPAWVQGMRVLSWTPSGDLWVLDAREGRSRLWKIEGGEPREVSTGPFQVLSQIAASPDGKSLAAIGSSPDLPDRAAVLRDGIWHDVALSLEPEPPPESCPTCEAVSWKAGGADVHGLLFLPRGPRPASGWPLLVNIHGGPTSQRARSFAADTCFFGDLGWAVLEVNYRGSTGYGESYRRALDGCWGVIDTLDCASGARAMVERGVADPRRLVVKGGSAGGFTVLNALAEHPNLFRAGISNYGVVDLVQLELTTHKFEAKYLHGLVAPYPERADLFRERSPLTKADRIRDALAIFQGADDKVVPPDQARMLSEALERSSVPHTCRVFDGEGHGWRRPETIAAYYADVESFLAQRAS